MKLFVLLLSLITISFPSFASFGADLAKEQLRLSGADKIYINDEINFSSLAEDILTGNVPSEQNVTGSFFKNLLAELKESISLCLCIIIIVVLLNVITNVSAKPDDSFDPSFYVCYMIIFMLGVSSFRSACEIAQDSIDQMNFFMKAAIPVLGTLITASGGIARTALICGSVVAISSTVTVITGVLFPVSTMSALISGVSVLGSDRSLVGFSSALKKASLWGLGIITTIFTTILSTRSFAAVNLDNVAGRTVKYAAGNFVPIVGGVLSETMESIIACGRLVKGAAGGASVIAILYICLAPIAKLVAIILVYKFTSAIITPISDGRLSSALDEFTSSIVIILAMVIFTSVMFIICAGIVSAV